MLSVLDWLFDESAWDFLDVYRALCMQLALGNGGDSSLQLEELAALNWWQDAAGGAFPDREEDTATFVRAFVIGAASELRDKQFG